MNMMKKRHQSIKRHHHGGQFFGQQIGDHKKSNITRVERIPYYTYHGQYIVA